MAKILLDFDSTLIDTQSVRLSRTNAKFGTNYSASDVVTWHNTGYFEKEHDEWMWGEECFLDPTLHLESPPVRNALIGVSALKNLGHDMVVVTDRPDCIHDVTRQWLKQHKINLPVYFTYHKDSYSLVGTKTKKDIVDEIGIEIVIEDSPHHSTELSRMPTVETVYLLDYLYNRNVDGPKITRVADWKELILIMSQVYVA